MNLTIIGAGYVGLITAVVFAHLGHKVWVVEIDKNKFEKLSKGEVPFYEPGIAELLQENLASGQIKFTSDYSTAIPEAEIIFICVGTPTKNGRADLTYVYAAAKEIAKNLRAPSIVVIKSTVPPGINHKIEAKMKKLTRVDFEIASVPEFLREGRALHDALHPHRIVIGTQNKKVAKKLLELHRKIPGKKIVCDPVSAQMIKYASNAFLPTKISFANSIAILCDKLGADAVKVLEGVGLDKRIGKDFLGAGLGYGGSCFPKDVSALIGLCRKHQYNFKILRAVEKTNQYQVEYFVKKIVDLCGGSVKGKTLVVLGLAFKPETSDMREARSIYVIDKLKELGAIVRGCDPVAIPEAKRILKDVDFFEDVYEALNGADGLLLVTEWKDYQNLDFKRIKALMRSPVVLDGRNIYNRKQLEQLGFIYGGIGK